MNNTGPSVTPAQQREEALFAAALAKAPGDRAAFLDGACHADPALRARLEALLAEQEQPDELLARPADADRPTLKIEIPPNPPDETLGQMLRPAQQENSTRAVGAITRRCIGIRLSDFRLLL
jgi:hypothetical protein